VTSARRQSVAGAFVPAIVGFVLAAIVGGIAGGLIFKWSWESSRNGAGSRAAVLNRTAASCQATKVAAEALPSVVTVTATNGQQ
jgi:hypothetical protein